MRPTRVRGPAAALILAALTLPGGTAAQAGADPIGDMIYIDNVDPMTDENFSYVLGIGEEGVGLDEGSIAWMCGRGELRVAASVETYQSVWRVQWRVDDDPPSERETWEATDNDLYVAPLEVGMSLTEAALPGASLLVRAHLEDGTDHDFRIGLGGLTAALRRLPCGPGGGQSGAAWARSVRARWQATADSLEAVRAAERRAEARQRQREQAIRDSLAAQADALDAENHPFLEVGDTIRICNPRLPGELVAARVGHPDGSRYIVPGSGTCGARDAARGEITRTGTSDAGRTWYFVKLFEPYYNAWVAARYLWPADNPPR